MWVALVPILAFIDKKNSFLPGVLCGFIANVLIFSWMWRTFNAAGIAKPTTIGVWLLLALILSLYFGIFNWGLVRINYSLRRIFFAGAAWVLLETIRSLILTGFPWALAAHTQAWDKPFIQLAAFTGVSGLTFLIIGFNAALAEFRRSKSPLLIMGVLVALIHLGGGYRLSRNRLNDGADVQFKVALLQANIDQYKKWDDAFIFSIKTTYDKLARKATAQHPDLILWPESAAPGWVPNEKPLTDWLDRTASLTRTFNAVGVVTAEGDKSFNAAFLYNPSGQIAGSYAKHHLVPFGEYIPFGGFMKRWIPYLGQLGRFDQGDGFEILNAGMARIALNICYEAIFSKQIRLHVQEGANLIANITNDGWFLTTGAPEQHYVTNIFRAVESGLPVVRSANTGISAVIDAYGRETVRSPLMTEGLYEGTVDLWMNPQLTFYNRWGDWFTILCLLFVSVQLFSICYTARHVTRT